MPTGVSRISLEGQCLRSLLETGGKRVARMSWITLWLAFAVLRISLFHPGAHGTGAQNQVFVGRGIRFRVSLQNHEVTANR
jgi:hypothetical protein